jgi:hypothetical protein
MRPEVVVVATPRINGHTRVGQAEKVVLVEPFISQSAVERFDEGVLDRFAGFDVVPVERRPFAQRKNTPPVSSVPLSLTTNSGLGAPLIIHAPLTNKCEVLT